MEPFNDILLKTILTIDMDFNDRFKIHLNISSHDHLSSLFLNIGIGTLKVSAIF